MNTTKKKQTHRNREQTIGCQWGGVRVGRRVRVRVRVRVSVRIRARFRVWVRIRVRVRVSVRVRVRVVIKPIPLSRYPLACTGILLGVQPWRRV